VILQLNEIQVQKPKMGLAGAMAANSLNMIGVGPFITIPIALAAMAGPQALLGWIAGAILSLCDGFVWAELGSAMPYSGGTYHYMLEAFGRERFGHLFSFLFLWQTILSSPILIASGAIGFAEYSTYLWPSLGNHQIILIGVAVCLLCTALLYRNIHSIAVISIIVSVIVVGTAFWVILTGATHFHAAQVLDFPPHAFRLDHAFFLGLAGSTIISIYCYNGYNNVCLIGDEVESPQRAIPRTIIISIVVVAVLYLAMNVAVIGVVPWRQAMVSNAVISDMMQMVYGKLAAQIIALLIMVSAFFGVYALILGYSRVPYAAAEQGHFFRAFAKLHTKGKFPYISLIGIGIASAAACLVGDLKDLITIFVISPILTMSIPQCIAVIMIRLRKQEPGNSYRMPLFPLPAIAAMLGWGYAFISSDADPHKNLRNMLLAIGILLSGTVVFLARAKQHAAWPFASKPIAGPSA
jgi:amino acid transporter